MNQLACAAIASTLLVTLGMGSAQARTSHVAHHAHSAHHHSWPLTTRYPEWPKSTFFGPRWTGDSAPWWKSDARTSAVALPEVTVRGHRPHLALFARLASALPSDCRLAARQGGPCGCWAEQHVFGTTAHVFRGMNLWLARAWLAFPHVLAEVGSVAVFGHHHVAPVVSVNGDGTVTVQDSWATHPVRMAGLVFVRPR
jgi:hypothetical protein